MQTSAQVPSQPTGNRLLDRLDPEAFARLAPHLERESLALGQVMHQPGGQMRYLHFPRTAIISLLYVMEDGASAEIAVLGNDGVLGISIFMGGETAPNWAIVQSAGDSWRIPTGLLLKEFGLGGETQQLLLRYTQALITQMAQTAVCNRYHTVDQQLCRWLLLSLDLLPSNELVMTHELIANMLGVRREGVSEAAAKLQKAGLVHYSRGHIRVLDRPAIEARVCECYRAVRNECERLLPRKAPKVR